MVGLLESASLFEVNVPEYKQLRACRRESLLLKTLWDFVYIVRTSIDDWKTTLWREINVEQMDIDCNRFSKNIKLLDKDVRAWNVYAGAESTVRNMMTSLKAVTELQNPAIRERHWQQLMNATGVGRRSAQSGWRSTTPTPTRTRTPILTRPTRLYILTSDARDFLARKSVSVSVSAPWNAGFTALAFFRRRSHF